MPTEVRDSTALIGLYERIGHASNGEHAYDTDAAQDTGRIGRRELGVEQSTVVSSSVGASVGVVSASRQSISHVVTMRWQWRLD